MIATGSVEPAIAAEFPGLGLRWTVAGVTGGGTPRGVRERLGAAATRLRGPDMVALRSRTVPQAYRTAFRQLGLDPDVSRSPIEAVIMDRLMHGGLGAGDRIDDALTLGIVETGVALSAFDEDTLRGELSLRAARAGETLSHGVYADEVGEGALVLADNTGPVALLFGRVSDPHAPGRRTKRVRVVATVVPGVPPAHVDEALLLAAEALAE
jgi:DNA/RNA-binding domain of Phe-tRNA-synthetase-like protein